MTLTDIIALLEADEGPDRALDAAICKAVDRKRWAQARNWAAMPCGAPEDVIERDAAKWAFNYTSSVDEAISLAERILPGCDICTQDFHADLRREGEPRHLVEVMTDLQWTTYHGPPEPEYQISGSAQSNSRAIAIVLATLRALSKQEEQHK